MACDDVELANGCQPREGEAMAPDSGEGASLWSVFGGSFRR